MDVGEIVVAGPVQRREEAPTESLFFCLKCENFLEKDARRM